MPHIEITAEAEEALREYNLRTVGRDMNTRNSTRTANGGYRIWLEESTFKRLRMHTLEGQSWSDAIVALCTGSLNKSN